MAAAVNPISEEPDRRAIRQMPVDRELSRRLAEAGGAP